ncbi:hypothetical protein ATE84_2598 [Aquimarina sp. MAR_2010_214]|uniref:hypothetical protein n=1 Tax=Aquimarina sp. MAR_2010_214 TaxID=1250026 RepID=UPI000C70BB78|nr:hypothetical protein [Aquimarina sp. MAR_2010_214]PKV50540.1 hypothetical protein ATE84_2598 [Aquimarina sp. MAR_2010_214]
MKFKIFIILLLTTLSGYTQSLNELYKKSIEAYKSKDYKTFEKLNLEALKLHPSQPTILFNLAASYVLNRKNEKAFEVLSALQSWNAELKFEDEDFKHLLEEKKFINELQKKASFFSAQKESSSILFEISNKYHIEDVVVIEDIAYLTDIRNGVIITYNLKTKKSEELLSLAGAAFAIIKGVDKNFIWVSSSMFPNYSKYDKEQNNKAFVYKINIKNRNIVTKIEIPEEAVIGSMVLAKNNKIYATNSVSPKIFVIDANKGILENSFEIKDAFNLQGITLDTAQQNIFVADYIKGIMKLNITNFSDPIWYTSDAYLLKGIDGLTCINNKTLIAIQNNSNPKKVIKLTIDTNTVTKIEILDNALPSKGEPTNGKLYKEKKYLYISNSQWPFYDKKNAPLIDKWEPQKIRIFNTL